MTDALVPAIQADHTLTNLPRVSDLAVGRHAVGRPQVKATGTFRGVTIETACARFDRTCGS
jgi:hypothetical protein